MMSSRSEVDGLRVIKQNKINLKHPEKTNKHKKLTYKEKMVRYLMHWISLLMSMKL